VKTAVCPVCRQRFQAPTRHWAARKAGDHLGRVHQIDLPGVTRREPTRYVHNRFFSGGLPGLGKRR
jgi:hypothetical protein